MVLWTVKHGGHLLLHQGGERHAGQDVAGRHRARHEPGVSRDTFVFLLRRVPHIDIKCLNTPPEYSAVHRNKDKQDRQNQRVVN